MTGLDELLDAAAERQVADPEWAVAAVHFGDEVVRFKFTELDGRTWAGFTTAAHPRPGNVVDATFGFNVTLAAELAAPVSGVRVDADGVETELSEAQWGKLFERVDPRGRQSITDAVVGANEYAHIGRLNNAKKLLEDEYKPKPSSPEN